MEQEKKYPLQKCQDDTITAKFRNLHFYLVNQIIGFCKENNIQIDEFNLHADGIRESIEFGEWTSATDSCLRFDEDLEHEVGKSLTEMTDEEYRNGKLNHQAVLFSM